MRDALATTVSAGIVHEGDWSGFWMFLVAVACVLAVIVYLFLRSQPPDER